MKKINVLVLCIVLSWLPSVFAADIKVVTEEYPPYNFTADNKITGCSTEIVQEMLKRAGITYSLNAYPWVRTYKLAQEEPNVLIYSIGRNEKREMLFKWVDVVAPYDVYFFKLKSRSDVQVGKLEDAKKYKIGAVRDDVRAQYLEKNGFDTAAMDLVPNDIPSIKKLMAGRIDLIPIDKLGLAYLMKQEGLKTGDLEEVLLFKDLSAGLYVAFSKQTDDAVVEKCKIALAEIKSDGTYDAIMKKYTE